jgi:hypothetical protein
VASANAPQMDIEQRILQAQENAGRRLDRLVQLGERALRLQERNTTDARKEDFL